MANDHKGLVVWQRAMKLVTAVYLITKKYPKEELYGLTSQIRRAAVSIPSNLAEGRAMSTTAHFVRYAYIARGSLAELETQITIGNDLGYSSAEESQHILSEISEIARMINKMIATLNAKIKIDKIEPSVFAERLEHESQSLSLPPEP